MELFTLSISPRIFDACWDHLSSLSRGRIAWFSVVRAGLQFHNFRASLSQLSLNYSENGTLQKLFFILFLWLPKLSMRDPQSARYFVFYATSAPCFRPLLLYCNRVMTLVDLWSSQIDLWSLSLFSRARAALRHHLREQHRLIGAIAGRMEQSSVRKLIFDLWSSWKQSSI